MNNIKFIDFREVDDEIKEKVRIWRNSDLVRKSMVNQHIISIDEHQRWINRLKDDCKAKYWIIFIDEIPIGVINLQNIDYIQWESEWGVYIGDVDFKGRGLGSDIILQFLDIFFDSLNFSKLVTKVLSSNTVAYRIYKKFGFREVNRVIDNGNEIAIMEYTKNEWNEHRERFL